MAPYTAAAWTPDLLVKHSLKLPIVYRKNMSRCDGRRNLGTVTNYVSLRPQREAEMSHQQLTQLGTPTAPPASPDEAVLERIDNPNRDVHYLVRFTCPEFTSICPVTGQPDFAHLVIDFVPDAHLVESKSLKLYLGSFRDHGAFHEDCTVAIAKRLVETIAPSWLRIGGYWYPRGGMPIDVFYQTGEPPAGVWIPDQGVASYRGRG